jgi:hypothetical protein
MTEAAREASPGWPEPETLPPPPEGPVTCQVCGAPHRVDVSAFCARCGEPVLALGWAP